MASPAAGCWPVKQVVQEYERAVIFRLGRLMAGGAKGPGKWMNVLESMDKYSVDVSVNWVLSPIGIFFILPCIDAYARVDLRTRTYDVPPQEVSANWGIYKQNFREMASSDWRYECSKVARLQFQPIESLFSPEIKFYKHSVQTPGRNVQSSWIQ